MIVVLSAIGGSLCLSKRERLISFRLSNLAMESLKYVSYYKVLQIWQERLENVPICGDEFRRRKTESFSQRGDQLHVVLLVLALLLLLPSILVNTYEMYMVHCM